MPSQTGEPRRPQTSNREIDKDVDAFKKKKRSELKSKALHKKKDSNYLFESTAKTIKRIKENPYDSRYDD